MARAVPPLLLLFEVHNASEVRALLAEGDDISVRETNKDRRVIHSGIVELERFADDHIGEHRYRTGLAAVDAAQLPPRRHAAKHQVPGTGRTRASRSG
jgi:hypothetical protein